MVEFSTVAMDLVILCIAIVNHFYFSTIIMLTPLHSGIQIDILRDTIAPQEPPPVLVYHGESRPHSLSQNALSLLSNYSSNYPYYIILCKPNKHYTHPTHIHRVEQILNHNNYYLINSCKSLAL